MSLRQRCPSVKDTIKQNMHAIRDTLNGYGFKMRRQRNPGYGGENKGCEEE